MRFATNCPQNGCPPEDAEPVNGEVIRFVRNNPPTAKDLETYADEGKGNPNDDSCRLCTLSVLRRLQDVEDARKAMGWFRKRLVAKAELSPSYGVIKQTGPYKFHYSFWVEVTRGTTVHEQFKVVPS